MKLVKKLKAYHEQKIDDAFFGFGIMRAKDYDSGVLGHLILWSVNIGIWKCINKLWIPF